MNDKSVFVDDWLAPLRSDFIPAGGLKPDEGFTSTRLRILAQFTKDEPLVGMIMFKDRLIVATSLRLFELVGEEMRPITAKEAT